MGTINSNKPLNFDNLRPKYSFDETIVIAPGTFTFKIGIASLKNPKQFRSFFGIRKKEKSPCLEKKCLDISKEIEDPVSASPKESKTSDIEILKVLNEEVIKGYLNAPTKEQIKNEEKYGEKDSIETMPETSFIKRELKTEEKFVFGEKVFELFDTDCYDIVPFFINGILNLERVSETVLSDVVSEFLKKSICSEEINIPYNDFKNYSVAFVVPMNFCKLEIDFFTNIILNKLGFKSLFFHQETVLACFGTGFSGACVVDIGHESTKVCCVQYGSAVLCSRIVLPYGGDDITRLCLRCLVSPSVNEFYCPVKKLHSETSPLSFSKAIKQLKESTCFFPGKSRAVKSFVADFDLNSGKKVKAKMSLSNVVALAPMGLFHPKMFRNYEEKKKRKYAAHIADKCRYEYEKTFVTESKSDYDQKNEGDRENIKFQSTNLSATIVDSIMGLAKLEDRMSMATSILLVGGTVKIPGLSEIIETKVKKILNEQKSPITHVEKLPRRDEGESGLSPELCSWLGMSIICGNESCRDMWITREEWRKEGNLLLLRRKLPFELEVEISNCP